MVFLMKCIVTGGAGFIGSHLCDRLIGDGHEVICVDNFITGNRYNIEHLFRKSRFKFIEHDCTQPLPGIDAVDVIFHFASPASPPKYQALPVETLLVNTVGTYHLLTLARRYNARFVFASTSEVYGDPKEHPQRETYWGNVNPVGPRSCYDEGKRAGEAYVATYMNTFGLDCRIVRIFNTYGPRMDLNDGRVVTNFIRQILDRKAPVIHGTGEQTRSFCYISDLVEGIVLVMNISAARGQVINLGNTEEWTIQELGKYIKAEMGYTGEFEYKDLPHDDPLMRRPDITKAKEILGWEPKVSIKQGLLLTIKYYQSLKKS